MNKFAIASIAAAFGLALAAPAAAHPEGHDNYDMPERKPVRVSAKEAVVKLVTQSKLPASWAKIDASGADFKTVGGQNRWVVTFDNPAVKKAQRKLYVVMTSGGDFVSAGYKPV